MSDAVKLAHEWHAQKSADDAPDFASQLADAVIAQDAELQKLRAGLAEALEIAECGRDRKLARIAELRKLVTP